MDKVWMVNSNKKNLLLLLDLFNDFLRFVGGTFALRLRYVAFGSGYRDEYYTDYFCCCVFPSLVHATIILVSFYLLCKVSTVLGHEAYPNLDLDFS